LAKNNALATGPQGPPTHLGTRISSVLRGQLFLFDMPSERAYSSRQGVRLLIVFLFLEALARPSLDLGGARLGLTSHIWWMGVKIAFLMLTAWLLVTGYAKVRLAELGLRGWSLWTRTEKHFFPQIMIITLVVFGFNASSGIAALWGRRDVGRILVFVCVPQLIWGFYQEFVYRGIVQTELVRRWGTWPGILVGNLIFTFGPLHFYHFALARHHPAHLWIFPAIFAIGLYFAVVYHRSGNLWIVGTLHGVGDWFIDGLGIVARIPR
jgi:membrane protease YdiL (CAAX protease family)